MEMGNAVWGFLWILTTVLCPSSLAVALTQDGKNYEPLLYFFFFFCCSFSSSNPLQMFLLPKVSLRFQTISHFSFMC